MNGVERSELGRRQQPRCIEDTIVDPQQVHPREYLPASSSRVRPKGEERTHSLPSASALDTSGRWRDRYRRNAADSGSRTASFTSADEST